MQDGDKLMLVGATYTLYLLIFVAFGLDVTGVLLDMAAALAVALIAAWLGWTRQRHLWPLFALLALSAVSDFANLLILNQPLSVPATAWSSIVGSNEIPLSMIFFGLFLFFWNCAWLYLAVTLVRRHGIGMAHWMALVILLGFIGAYIEQYRSFNFNLLDAGERFSMLLFVLELSGVLLGVMCTLLGASRQFLFMLIGFTLFAAIDIVAIDLRLHKPDADAAALQPVWALGHMLIFAGIWLMQAPARPTPDGAVEYEGRSFPAVDLLDRGQRHSQLSSILIVFSLGAVFMVAAVERVLDGAREWFAMFFLLFCVSAAVFMSLATSRLDRAIQHLRDQLVTIFRSKLEHNGDDDGERIRRTLRLTGLDHLLAEVRQEAAVLRENVVVLGPERLNRPVGGTTARHGAPRCFIMMKFGAAWSAEVDRVIRDVCSRQGVVAIRGDDIFSPTDILDDIWQQIMDADFVIADVTDRNTNVFYELGMSHAVGKPVVILSQTEDDVPIDLKTRRWLPYDPGRPAELAERLGKSVEQVLEKYGLAERKP